MYCYKRVRNGETNSYHTSMLPLNDPELVEMTEPEYEAEIEELVASKTPDGAADGDIFDSPTDDATEEDFLEALNELGVIS